MRLSLGGGEGEKRAGLAVCGRSYQLLVSFPLFTHLHVALHVAGM